MKKQLIFYGKSIDVQLSDAATNQSGKLTSKLIVEIQLYFSCLLGKRLVFYSDQSINGVSQQGVMPLSQGTFSEVLLESQQLSDNIYVRFSTVMTKSCSVSDYAGAPPVTDFKIKNNKPYVPSWLNIDFSKNRWLGEYGWPASKAGFSNTRQPGGGTV